MKHLTNWVIEKLTVSQPGKESPLFYETRNLKVHCCLHKSLPLNSYCQPDDSSVSPPILFLSCPFTISSVSSQSSKRFLSIIFPTKTCMHKCHVHCPSHPPCFDNPNNVWWGVQIMSTFVHFPVISFYQIQVCSSTPCSWTYSWRWETNFDTLVNQQAKFYFHVFYIISQQMKNRSMGWIVASISRIQSVYQETLYIAWNSWHIHFWEAAHSL